MSKQNGLENHKKEGQRARRRAGEVTESSGEFVLCLDQTSSRASYM